MGINQFLNRLKSKKQIIDGSISNIPVMGQSQTLTEVYEKFLDEINSRQLARLRNSERPVLCLLDAYNYAQNEYDLEGFMDRLVFDAFITSASENGFRSEQLANIAVGQMGRDFQVEMAEIRSGGKNKELKNVI